MALDRIVLMLFCLACVALAGVYIAFVAHLLRDYPRAALGVFVCIVGMSYLVVRVISDRLRSQDDAHYDRIEK